MPQRMAPRVDDVLEDDELAAAAEERPQEEQGGPPGVLARHADDRMAHADGEQQRAAGGGAGQEEAQQRRRQAPERGRPPYRLRQRQGALEDAVPAITDRSGAVRAHSPRCYLAIPAPLHWPP
jgi:hypothetical protein